jgi:hypothetical protein
VAANEFRSFRSCMIISASDNVANRVCCFLCTMRASRPEGSFLCVTVATNFKLTTRRESTAVLIITFVLLSLRT